MSTLSPSEIPAAYQRALDLQRQEKLNEAVALYQMIIATNPAMAEAHYQLGRIGITAMDYKGAVKSLAHANRLRPNDPIVLKHYALALNEAGETQQAVRAYRDLIKLQPRDMNARTGLGRALQRAGDFKAAEKEFRRGLKREPESGLLYHMMTQSRKLRRGEPLIREMLAAYKRHAMPAGQRAHLCFGLAKAMEDSGQHDKVFRFLNEANALVHSFTPYDRADRQKELDDFHRAFDGFDFRQPGLDSDDGLAPIFVTGMPRSGTTLVETILASHSQVEAAGENSYVANVAVSLVGGRSKRPAQPLAEASDAELRRARDYYRDILRSHFEFGRLITDKSITTYYVIGLMRHLFPAARFVVVSRDPRDNLLSIYKNVFQPGLHGYAYNFDSLAFQYASYQQMIAFWRDRLPEGTLTEIRYEDLIDAPEAESRRLIEAMGLDWEDACLDFHASKRVVKTNSLHQVRQPIYKSSKRAWEKFADDLAPLTEALRREGVL